MKDRKTDMDIDFEKKLAEIADKTLRGRTNNNIYDRFISRVENTDNNGSKVPENTSSHTTFSADDLELELSTNQDEEGKLHSESSGITTTETVFDFSNNNLSIEEEGGATEDLLKFNYPNSFWDKKDKIIESTSDIVFETETETETDKSAYTYDNDDNSEGEEDLATPPIINVPASRKKTPKSSRKPLIIGIVCGALLIAITVATLVFMGVLSTPTDTVIPDNTDSNGNIEESAQTGSVPSINDEQVISNDASAGASPSATNASVTASPQDELTDDDQSGSTNSVDSSSAINNKKETTDATSAEAATSESQDEPAISYEDFKQESQNTLYRETND